MYQKIINMPSLTTSLMFIGGLIVGFFFPDMLFSSIGQIKGSGTEYIADKLKRIYSLMDVNPSLTIVGGGLLIGIVYLIKKVLPLVVGIIIGLTSRMFLIQIGFSEPKITDVGKLIPLNF